MTRDEAKALFDATAFNLGTGLTVVAGSSAKDDDLVSGIGAPKDGVRCTIVGFHDGIAEGKDSKGNKTEQSFLIIDLFGEDGAPYRVNIRRLTKNKGLAAKYGFLGKFGTVKEKVKNLIDKTLTIDATTTQYNDELGYDQVTDCRYTIA